MSHICSPKENLTKWESDLIQFIKEYKPTMSELRRLMNTSLGNEYHKVQSVFTPSRMARRLVHIDFESKNNSDFVSTMQALIDTV